MAPLYCIVFMLIMLIWKVSKMTILKLCSHFSIVILEFQRLWAEPYLTPAPLPPALRLHPHGKAKDFPYLFPHSQPQKKIPAGLGTHKCGCVSALSLPVLGLSVSTALPFSLKHFAAFSCFHSIEGLIYEHLLNVPKNEHLCGVDSTGEDWAENIPAQESNTTGSLVLHLGSICLILITHLSSQFRVQGPLDPSPLHGLWVLTQNTQLLS